MDEQQIRTGDNQKRAYRILLIAGIMLVAFNLRPAITSVGPVIGIIRDELGLANWSAGLLTSLPLIAFAVMSPVAPRLGNRFSNERALVFGLILLVFGIAIRVVTSVTFLYAGTLLVGCGIAISNVLLPGVLKEKFPNKVELMTGVYSTVMGTFAAMASGISIPIAKGLGLGWQVALIIWIIPAIAGMVLWLYLSKNNRSNDQDKVHQARSSAHGMWHSRLAWQVALFMGFQSFLFYVTISWLPEILHDKGVSIGVAGWMLSFTQIIGLPFSFLVPLIAGKLKSQWGLVIFLGLSSFSGYTGLLISHSFPMIVISTTLIGIALGGIFPLALAFLGMRARNAKQAAELSGMAQSLGYLLAAIGPIFIGYLYDITNSWNVPLLTLLGLTLIVVIFGSLAGRDKYVLD
ncbi:putative transporter YycB [Lentibacillus populi]|uniref:Transporter YycB n=1 Tax=Lentibacillus populi TaxID=1827502 RepID=A0A9W5U1F8_9BACI|nr:MULTISPECIES: MFS transporter [Bacillaceae]GGB60113.1 putative transporter YycB [Lentibacillus populi]